jgi:SAM-dependent methyltransferase
MRIAATIAAFAARRSHQSHPQRASRRERALDFRTFGHPSLRHRIAPFAQSFESPALGAGELSFLRRGTGTPRTATGLQSMDHPVGSSPAGGLTGGLSGFLRFAEQKGRVTNIYLREVIDTLRSIGIAKTMRHVWGTLLDYSFDWKNLTDTAPWIRLADLEINSKNKSRGIDYHPTRVKPFYKLFRFLKLPKDAGFVDLGCGKGRTLIMSMELGFNKVVGVEFSSVLCQIARRNVELYQARRTVLSEVTVIESDVIDYHISHSDRIFYLFNPFDEVILRRIMVNIRNSMAEPRKIWIIYYNPVHHNIIEDIGRDMLLARKEIMFNGCLFFVYESKL